MSQQDKGTKVPKWAWWVGGFLLLSVFSYHVGKQADTQPPVKAVKLSTPTVPHPTPSASPKPVPKSPQVVAVPKPLTDITEGIAAMDALKPPECAEAAEVCLSLLNNFARTLFDTTHGDSLTAAQQAQVATFRTKLVSLQQRTLPIIRKAYGKIIGDKLWEHDVTARVLDDGNRTIEFVGWFFAAHRNIKDMNENIWPMVRKLRFTRVQYRWMKDGDMTFFTTKGSDSEVLTWDDGNHIIEVK